MTLAKKKRLTINTVQGKEKGINDFPTGKSPKHNTEGDLPMPDKTADNKPDNGNDKPATPVVATNSTPENDTVTVSKSELTKLIGDVIDTKFNERDERNAASEKADLVNKVVGVNLLSKEVAETLPVNALRELASNAGNKQSAQPVNGAPASSTDTGKITLENMFKDYSINDHLVEHAKQSVN